MYDLSLASSFATLREILDRALLYFSTNHLLAGNQEWNHGVLTLLRPQTPSEPSLLAA